MQKIILILLSTVMILSVAGCASTPHRMSYAEYRATLPSPESGKGRIWFYRTHIFFGDGIQPRVNLDWKPVGSSIAGYFYVVEAPAGHHEVETVTEWPQKTAIEIKTNEDSYVQLSARPGIGFGHVIPVVVSEDEAVSKMKNLKSLK